MTQHTAKFMAGTLAAAFLGGGLASALLSDRVSAQGSPAAVTTSQVNLVNRAGRLRAILSAEDERGMTSLTLFNDAGQRRLALTAEADGTPALQLFDRGEAARIQITVENDQPAIVVGGAGGDRAALSAVGGSPALSFQNGQRVRADIGMGRGGAPRLSMYGPNGQAQVGVSVSDQGEPVVTLRDDTGRGRASLGVVQGATVLNLSDQRAVRVVLGVGRDSTPSLSLLDETGKVTSRVP